MSIKKTLLGLGAGLLLAVSFVALGPSQSQAQEQAFLRISPFQEQDKAYLIDNTAQIADVNDAVNAHRFADGTSHFTYKLRLTGLKLPAELRITSVGAQYKVSVSNDGTTFRTIALEQNPVKDESNKSTIVYRVNQADVAAGSLYVKFEDSFPQDGWGASFRGGPLEIVPVDPFETSGETFLSTSPLKEADKPYLAVIVPDTARADVFLWTTPYKEQDKPYLFANQAQLADVNDPVNAHRFADGTSCFTYRFDLRGLVLPAKLVVSSVGAQYEVSVSNDGTAFAPIAVEINPVKDESNKTTLEYDITQGDLAAGNLYVKFEDSFPQDGWGASFRKGPIAIVDKLAVRRAGASDSPANAPRTQAQAKALKPSSPVIVPDTARADVFLWTTPYKEQDKPYLFANQAQLADVNDPVNAHRFADGNGYFVYKFPLAGLRLPAWLELSRVGAQYRVSISSDNRKYATIAEEKSEVKDESNGQTITYRITPDDVKGGFLYVKFEDSFPKDGWGASLRRGPITIYQAPKQAAVFSYYPKLAAPERLYAIAEGAMTPAQLLLVSSIQGIVAQTRPEIYVVGSGNYPMWLANLTKQYGIPVERHDDVNWFIEHYEGLFTSKGYILAKLGTQSVNVATTLSGVLQAPIVDESLKPAMDSLGFKMLVDVRGKDEHWAFKTYKNKLNRTLLFQQDPAKINLRDYAIATRSYTFFETQDPLFIKEVYDWAQKDTPVLGWGPGNEDAHVGLASMLGHLTIPADWAFNLSALAGVKVAKLAQPNHAANIKFEEKAHYVTFVLSDGDNIQWLVGDMAANKKYFASEKRGEFPMGFTISPSLADLAPTAMKWYYDNAKQDYFVAGVSGTGYIFPSSYPALGSFTYRLNEYLGKADLSIVSILDPAPMDSPDFKRVATAYAKLPNVLGGIYLTGDKYAGGHGQVAWVEGKPFAAVRESLWSTDPLKMAERINSYPTDPTNPASYTVVNVHPWSHDLNDVAKLVDHLGPDVKVVNPEEFFLQMIYNLGGRFPTVKNDADVKIASPASRETVSGVLEVAGNASSSAAITSVLVKVDDGQWLAAEGTETWKAVIDTSGLSDGPHVIRAMVLASNGARYQDSEEVIVSNHSETGTIKGTVTYAHSPVPGAAVSLGERKTVTDQSGVFEFKFVPKGKVDLVAKADGFPDAKANVDVATGVTANVELALPVVVDTATSWTFDTSSQGWKAGVVSPGPPHMGKSFWDGGKGNKPGSLCFDGSDYGAPDGKANAWFFNLVRLPANANTITFDTRGDDKAGGAGGAMRLVLVDENGKEHALLPWEMMKTADWVTRTGDISQFAGQTVVLRFEQGDGDVGIAEYRWIDNIAIR